MFFAFVVISWNARNFLALEVEERGWGSAKLLAQLQAQTICNWFPTTYDWKTQGIVATQSCRF